MCTYSLSFKINLKLLTDRSIIIISDKNFIFLFVSIIINLFIYLQPDSFILIFDILLLVIVFSFIDVKTNKNTYLIRESYLT